MKDFLFEAFRSFRYLLAPTLWQQILLIATELIRLHKTMKKRDAEKKGAEIAVLLKQARTDEEIKNALLEHRNHSNGRD